jgi:hypothetical protein
MISQKNRNLIFWLGSLIFLFLMSTRWALPTPRQENFDAPLINEFMVANKSGLTDEDGDYSDWIEIFNPGAQAINLSGWSLTDNPDQPNKWTFPNRTLASGEYLRINGLSPIEPWPAENT